MRNILILSGLTVLFYTSSCATVSGVEAIVVRDCTGTYVRIDEKDYLVCNINLLEKYNEGDTVRVRFSRIDKCPELDSAITCMMYHQNEGMVRLKKVNRF